MTDFGQYSKMEIGWIRVKKIWQKADLSPKGDEYLTGAFMAAGVTRRMEPGRGVFFPRRGQAARHSPCVVDRQIARKKRAARRQPVHHAVKLDQRMMS